MSILLQKKNVGDYSYMSSPNIYYRVCLDSYIQLGSKLLLHGGGIARDTFFMLLSSILNLFITLYMYA